MAEIDGFGIKEKDVMKDSSQTPVKQQTQSQLDGIRRLATANRKRHREEIFDNESKVETMKCARDAVSEITTILLPFTHGERMRILGLVSRLVIVRR